MTELTYLTVVILAGWSLTDLIQASSFPPAQYLRDWLDKKLPEREPWNSIHYLVLTCAWCLSFWMLWIPTVVTYWFGWAWWLWVPFAGRMLVGLLDERLSPEPPADAVPDAIIDPTTTEEGDVMSETTPETEPVTSGVYRRVDGLYAYRIVASNGEIVATDGGQGYENRIDAQATYEKVVTGAYRDTLTAND